MKRSSLIEARRAKVSPEVRRRVDLSFLIVDRIHSILDEKGLKQKDLANMLGKKESEISKWMRGTHNFTIETISSIENVLDVPILLKGKSLSGDVYITGNQDALSNWNPMGVKMNQVNDSTYTIDLNLRLPAEYKFTQGTWEQQPFPKYTVPGNLRIADPNKTVIYHETD